MFVGALALWWRLSLVFLAGIAAGVANGVAGGGTFITFPTLLALGVPALQANLSTTVGVLPSYLGSLRVFRTQLAPLRQLIVSLLPSCVLGAAAGAALLLAGSPTTFRLVVPWLIGAGTILFAISPIITRRLAHIDHAHPSRRWALFLGVFVVSIYGGYFGAGLGILLLAVLAVALPLEIKELQGLLVRAGFTVGKVDGVLGQQSRSAIKAMQIKYGLPADSWPTAELLAKMRGSH